VRAHDRFVGWTASAPSPRNAAAPSGPDRHTALCAVETHKPVRLLAGEQIGALCEDSAEIDTGWKRVWSA
jgi:hypothetical protein